MEKENIRTGLSHLTDYICIFCDKNKKDVESIQVLSSKL